MIDNIFQLQKQCVAVQKEMPVDEWYTCSLLIYLLFAMQKTLLALILLASKMNRKATELKTMSSLSVPAWFIENIMCKTAVCILDIDPCNIPEHLPYRE